MMYKQLHSHYLKCLYIFTIKRDSCTFNLIKNAAHLLTEPKTSKNGNCFVNEYQKIKEEIMWAYQMKPNCLAKMDTI